MFKLVVVLFDLIYSGHSLPMNYFSLPFLYRKEWALGFFNENRHLLVYILTKKGSK